jgi:hypothetical protein
MAPMMPSKVEQAMANHKRAMASHREAMVCYLSSVAGTYD